STNVVTHILPIVIPTCEFDSSPGAFVAKTPNSIDASTVTSSFSSGNDNQHNNNNPRGNHGKKKIYGGINGGKGGRNDTHNYIGSPSFSGNGGRGHNLPWQ
ncbi:hypothetical protein A2U01_0068789, partial [Trifolium medium]|nr:hypothetical protein [Trifolium medium]